LTHWGAVVAKKKVSKKKAKKKASKKKATRRRAPTQALEVLPRSVGRPRSIESPEEFEYKCQEYFDLKMKEMKENPLTSLMYRPTLTGLILAIGLNSRESLAEYGRRPEYSDPVAKAKTTIESIYELMLGTSTASGAAFALRNFGWKDKAEPGDDDDNDLKEMSVLEKATRMAALLRKGQRELPAEVKGE